MPPASRCACAWTAPPTARSGSATDGAWTTTGGGRRWRAAYFKLVTRDGLLCTIYLDEIRGTWHLERIFD